MFKLISALALGLMASISFAAEGLLTQCADGKGLCKVDRHYQQGQFSMQKQSSLNKQPKHPKQARQDDESVQMSFSTERDKSGNLDAFNHYIKQHGHK